MSTPEDRSAEEHGQTSRKVGWSADIVAPRQEIDTLSRLYEEASIQEMLSGKKLEPEQFLDAYRQARAAYRAGEQALESSPKQTFTLTSRLALFGTQAAARARRRSQERAIMSCNCPDEPGLLAVLAESITKDGATILGAFMSVVAGHLLTAFLLSGPEVKHREIRKEHSRMEIDYTTVGAEDVDWPLPGSSYWHASARLRGDQSLLLALIAEIKCHRLLVVTLSSWLEDESAVQVLDLNFAIAPGPYGDDLQTIRKLESSVREKLKDVRLAMTQVASPTRYRTRGNVVSTSNMDTIVNIIGQADPDFVNRVLLDVSGIDSFVDFRACSVGILDGLAVLTIVLGKTERLSPGTLEKQITSRFESSGTEVVSVSVFRGAHCRRDEASSWPTHELSIHTTEQSRAIAKVARLVSEFDANIAWFVSQVLDPVVGDRSSVAAIEMHIYVPPDRPDLEQTRPRQTGRRSFREAVGNARHGPTPGRKRPGANYDELNARLRTLADTEGWLHASMGPWSLGDAPVDAG